MLPGMRFFFGDDICISYARLDGTNYAAALANALTKEKISCRLDQWATHPGREVPKNFMDALMRSSVLVVIASKGSGNSLAVKCEIEEFLKTRRPIIPIDLDGSIRAATWWPLLEGLAVSPDQGTDGLAQSPAETVLNRVKNTSGFTRRNQRLARSVIASLLLLTVIGAVSVYSSLAAVEQRRIAGHIRALSTLQFGEIVKLEDPAMAIRFAALAEKTDPAVAGTDLMVAALFSNPAWARIPMEYAEKIKPQLFPTFSEEFSFLTDPAMTYVARQEINADRQMVSVTDVDSGLVKAQLRLAEGERFLEERPYARALLVTRRPIAPGATAQFTVYTFPDIATKGRMAPALQISAKLFSCAHGTWPCFALSSEQRLQRCEPIAACTDIASIADFAADALQVHPSGKAVLLLDKYGSARWIDTAGGAGPASAKDLTFNSGQWYTHRPYLPWFKWGPNPYQLLVMAPSWTGSSSRQADARIWLTALDVRSGTRAPLKEILPIANGLAKPLFEMNRTSSRVLVNGADPGQVEVLTIDWTPAGAIARLGGREQLSRLSIANTSESAANTLSGAVSPNGLYAVVGYDHRGLSGTQPGLGVLKSWNLEALDRVDSGRPEAADIPVGARRHVGRIAYSDDSTRIAALDTGGVVSVFRVRASEPPLLKTKYRIPEDIEERLSAKPVQLDQLGRNWLVKFGDHDRQVFDVQTGKVTSLEKSIGCGKVLAVDSAEKDIVVASETCLARVSDATVKRFPLAHPIEDALVGKTLISGRTADRVYFFSTADFQSRGYAKLDDNAVVRDVFTEVQSAAKKREREFLVPEIYPADARVRMYRRSDAGELESWAAKLAGANQAATFKRIWVRKLPADGWYSIRRLLAPDILMIAYRADADADQAQPILLRLEGASGRIYPGFQGKTDGAESIFEVAELHRRDANTVFAALRLASGGVRIERWNIASGVVEHSFLLDGVSAGSSRGVREILQRNGVPLIFVDMKKGDAQIGAFSLRDGALLWSGPGKGHALRQFEFTNGKLLPAQDATAMRMEKLMSQGGAGLADKLTRVQISDAVLEDLLQAR